MDFARVLQLVDSFFTGSNRQYAVIGAVGVAAHGVSRTTFDVDFLARKEDQPALVAFLELPGVDADEIRAYFDRYGLEDLRDRLG